MRQRTPEERQDFNDGWESCIAHIDELMDKGALGEEAVEAVRAQLTRLRAMEPPEIARQSLGDPLHWPFSKDEE